MDGLKQRIIGALVLISLAVIFVPMVFDEPHSERTSTNIKIPEEPPFPEVTTPASDASRPSAYKENETSIDDVVDKPSTDAPAYRLVEESDAAAAAPQAAVQSQKKPVAETTSTAVTTNTVKENNAAQSSDKSSDDNDSDSTEYAASLKGAWVVQLGSFGNNDNARRLRNDVRKKGYGSSLQEVVRGDTKMTRVFSGPFASKSDAEAAKKALDEAFSLNSLVTTGDK